MRAFGNDYIMCQWIFFPLSARLEQQQNRYLNLLSLLKKKQKYKFMFPMTITELQKCVCTNVNMLIGK